MSPQDYAREYVRLSLLGVFNINNLTECTKVLPQPSAPYFNPPDQPVLNMWMNITRHVEPFAKAVMDGDILSGLVGMLTGQSGQGTANQTTSNQATGSHDTGSQDTGNQDTGNQDAGDQDTDNTDTGNTDTGNADTGNTDTGNTDAGNQGEKKPCKKRLVRHI